MITEQGRIVAIETGAIWVETIQKSTCGGCSARSGCGTGLLGDYFRSTSHIRVLVDDESHRELAIDDTVEIGIPENALALGALSVYLLPLLAMLGGAVAGHSIGGGVSDLGAIIGAVCGFGAGAGASRLLARANHNKLEREPRLLRVCGKATHAIAAVNVA